MVDNYLNIKFEINKKKNGLVVIILLILLKKTAKKIKNSFVQKLQF